MQASLDKSTGGQLDKIRSMFGENRQAVVNKLLERVTEVTQIPYFKQPRILYIGLNMADI